MGVVGVVLAGAVAYGISSWYVGQRAQDYIETAVVEGNARLGKVLGEELSTQPVKLSISRYDRGWLSSNIIYSLKFSGSGGKSPNSCWLIRCIMGRFRGRRFARVT
ncbi:DUF945 family protein [Neopusillimonas aromaticivorans]|uniref:DUF945 family protein n=1 Tax=Neopusillimonas aromaticivorans TaxID=2979868 RepID=UPI002597A4BD|nr:DUF945 family protein [Neopusillimonas aromaticivorans]WJJ93148.1 DUF945 family protein [Neopusillimonas aromaticivorans]